MSTNVRHYRKKPVVIEAMRWDGSLKSTDDVTYWCGGQYDYEVKSSDHTDKAEWIAIPTLEGVMRASVGDWIIRGVQGEFYPCKPDIFEATYEAVTEPTDQPEGA